ncbi:MAG TPA: glycoside hydrolase family 65 protein, partial [Candidatus Binatia bacterium]|nr:glycoside hydrolase family 65 protein [Candidatus Binatia bacterium]
MTVDAWLLAYEGFDAAGEGVREALCTLGNGYFATRGAAAEAQADGVHYPGTYLSGGYDRLVSELEGGSVENEDLVNLPNWLPFTIRVADGEWLAPDHVERLDHQQRLDMRAGVLTRIQRFRDAEGRTTQVLEHRLVSMDDPHLAAQQLTVVPENWSGRLQVRAALDGRIVNAGVRRYQGLDGDHLDPLSSGHEGDRMWLRAVTRSSRLQVAVAARTRLVAPAGAEPERAHRREPAWVAQDLTLDVEPGTPVTVEKIVALYSGRDRAISECEAAARSRVERAGAFEELQRDHRQAWERLWRHCRVEVDRSSRRALTVSTFHLLQTLSPHTTDLDVGVPARGLHGEAYRGHVFWDELFVLPFFNLRLPEVTRALLLYRWRRLPEARWAARQAGFEGAMYPWQSGSDGREET